MKVTVDFMPPEYKSFVLDVKALGFLVVVLLASAAVAFLNQKDYQDKVKGLEGQISREEEEISLLSNKINSKSYNQGEIQELIDKFNFIREAVGARDFPYLRFYHSLEKTLPIDENTGARRVAIKSLSESKGNKYKVHGIARHWDDLLQFEKSLNNSSFLDTRQKREVKNFTGVKMGGWTRTDQGMDFTCEFTFTP